MFRSHAVHHETGGEEHLGLVFFSGRCRDGRVEYWGGNESRGKNVTGSRGSGAVC
jgi:hypothetical protein